MNETRQLNYLIGGFQYEFFMKPMEEIRTSLEKNDVSNIMPIDENQCK